MVNCFQNGTRSSWVQVARVVGTVACLLTGALRAQEEEPGPGIEWQRGPTKAQIGSIAEIAVPDGYQFTGPQGTQAVMQMMQNPVAGNELGLLVPLAEEQDWFIVFEYDDVGYVKDDEKDKLDADEMLKSIREGNAAANVERKQRGWAPLEIIGWEVPPGYDAQTNNLNWAIRGGSEGSLVVNYNTRLLGRSGVMSANLVIDPEQLQATLPEFNKLLGGYAFQSGKKYSEFRAGDKVAKYGLAALVTGGAAAVAVKAGLFKKLWKLIVFVFVAGAAALKKFFGRRSE